MSLMIYIIKLYLVLFCYFIISATFNKTEKKAIKLNAIILIDARLFRTVGLYTSELDATAAVLCIKKPYFFALVTITEKGERKW